jgi:hypothetical protein
MREIDRDILRMTGHLLDDPKRRVMSTLVADEHGIGLNSVIEPDACRWCLVGAIAACRAVLEKKSPLTSHLLEARRSSYIFQLAREYLDVDDLVVAWVLRQEQERIVERLKAA